MKMCGPSHFLHTGEQNTFLFGGFEWEIDFCPLISCDQDYNAINVKTC